MKNEEQKLLAEIEKKNENGASWSEWDAFLLGRIALALSQIVDRLDTLSEALDSFRPRWIESEEPEEVKVYAPAAFSDEAIKKFREFTGLIDSVTAKLKETYGGEDNGETN